MKKTLTWISPHKTALVMAITALVIAGIFGLIGFLFMGVMLGAPGGGSIGSMMSGLGGMFMSWLITPVLAYAFTFLYCLLFNFVVRMFGGIEIHLEDSA